MKNFSIEIFFFSFEYLEKQLQLEKVAFYFQFWVTLWTYNESIQLSFGEWVFIFPNANCSRRNVYAESSKLNLCIKFYLRILYSCIFNGITVCRYPQGIFNLDNNIIPFKSHLIWSQEHSSGYCAWIHFPSFESAHSCNSWYSECN